MVLIADEMQLCLIELVLYVINIHFIYVSAGC